MQEQTSRPTAVLWDMDGTLVDTEPYWLDVEQRLVAEHGGTWTTADAMQLVGNPLPTSAAYLRDVGGVKLGIDEIVDYMLAGVIAHIQVDVPWRPNGRELLADLRAQGVLCALVTMSYTNFVAPVLAALPLNSFDAIVTGDRVTHGKPHPEPYLAAASMLGVRAEECIAIEDSNTGAKSAESAGCRVLVVENHVPVLPGERRYFADVLPATTSELSALFAS